MDAVKVGNTVLERNCISVLNISVPAGWNSESMEEALDEIEKKMGKAPLYVVSGNGCKLLKAIREKGYAHIRGIGHTAALPVERVYKETDGFKDFSKVLSAMKAKEAMQATGYLLPPCQRTIARFMNLPSMLKWSQQMKKVFSKLDVYEQQTFEFVKTHKGAVKELSCLSIVINQILKLIKNRGLSQKNIDACLKKLDRIKNDKPGLKQSKERTSLYFKRSVES